MSTERLEMLLHEVAQEIEYPETPELALSVAQRIARDPTAPQRTRTWRRPILVTAVIVVLIGFFTLAFSPTARRAVADLLGIAGIRIDVESGGPRHAPRPDLDAIDLGERVSVTEAEAVVRFDVKGAGALLGPSRTYLDRSIGETGMVSTVFYPPRAPEEVVYLITEFRASVEEAFFKKVAGTDGALRLVDVDGTTGYWLSGAPHEFFYVDSSGAVRRETIRLAGNVLLWERGGITYRVEGAADLDEALRIAASLH